ncbi:MAG TPA: hypothetical protein VL728_19410 [Cyclobacteriaceae bacterium]|jgi:hypothetical protein|nr:hypothetical protein [Cyclobacteriaceae bacterium]
MGRHTRAEFQKITGLSRGNLFNYIKRGKIIEENGLIDDKNPVNLFFLERKGVVLEEIPQEKTTTPRPKNQSDESKVEPYDDDDVDSQGDQTLTGLNKTRIKVDIAKKRKETELLKLREQKIKGEIVPVADVSVLFSNHTQSIFSALKDWGDELIIEIAEEARLSGEQLARRRKRMIERLNNAVDRANLMTKKSMGIITDNFSISKGVGEHE